mmetsp:Transcript_24358/g.78588  ORF Transcript_24358/g.78588 Transcript_24358/m.78588 type:complete len:216 (+) Transcript_24358:1145-1792(+)
MLSHQGLKSQSVALCLLHALRVLFCVSRLHLLGEHVHLGLDGSHVRCAARLIHLQRKEDEAARDSRGDDGAPPGQTGHVMDSEYQVLDAHHRVVEEEAAVTAGQQSRGRRRLLAGGVQARREHRQWHNVQGRNFLSYWQRRSKHGGLRSLRRRPDRLGCENWLRRWGCRCLAHRRREVCSAGCRCRIAGVAQLSERFRRWLGRLGRLRQLRPWFE